MELVQHYLEKRGSHKLPLSASSLIVPRDASSIYWFDESPTIQAAAEIPQVNRIPMWHQINIHVVEEDMTEVILPYNHIHGSELVIINNQCLTRGFEYEMTGPNGNEVRFFEPVPLRSSGFVRYQTV